MWTRTSNPLCLLLILILSAGAAGVAPAAQAPSSALFPYCWGGVGNDAVYYTQGLMLRQLILYSNPSKTDPVTNVRIVFEAPARAVEAVKAITCDGYDRVKTEMKEELTGPGGDTLRVTAPMWDIKPGFTWKGITPWSIWPGWWSALYVKGKRPGVYEIRWHLESDQGNEPVQSARLVVLPRPPQPAPLSRAPGQGVGVWIYSLSAYIDSPEVAEGLAQSLAACRVSRVYVSAAAVASIKALRAQRLEVDLTNAWDYSVFAPTEPPEEARACNEKLERIPGNAWCPTYVGQRGSAWERAVRPSVTEAIKKIGGDGYMLDYEGAAAPGYNACNICFCERCRAAYAKALGGEAAGLQWPADVRPGGKLHQKWLDWRCQQGALYVKNIADLAREGNPKARTYTWSGGYYKPYPQHLSYSQACSDITKFAPYLTAPTVGTYVYPNDPAKALVPDPDFGVDPGNWGKGLLDMISVVKWTAEALRPQPVIPCVSGGHTPGGSATPLASIGLLRYQILNHILDGATGVDFWGTGPFEDGRYLAFLAELANIFERAKPYLGRLGQPVPREQVKTEARSYQAEALISDRGRMIFLINTDDRACDFTLSTEVGRHQVHLRPYEADVFEVRRR